MTRMSGCDRVSGQLDHGGRVARAAQWKEWVVSTEEVDSCRGESAAYFRRSRRCLRGLGERNSKRTLVTSYLYQASQGNPQSGTSASFPAVPFRYKQLLIY